MLQYKVGFFFSDDVKDAKLYNNYDQAFDDYLDRLKTEFHKLGYIPKTLSIEYIENGKSIGRERLVSTNKE